MKTEYKILKLRELEQAKKDSQARLKTVRKTSPSTPSPDTSIEKPVLIVPGEPPINRKVKPRPERLRHRSAGEIKVLAADGALTPAELEWFRTRNIPDRETPSQWDWMKI